MFKSIAAGWTARTRLDWRSARRLTWPMPVGSEVEFFLLGSVPNKVSHHSLCSVLIIRTT